MRMSSSVRGAAGESGCFSWRCARSLEPDKVTVFGSKNFAEQKTGNTDYALLVREIMHFFQTGVSPVPPEETIEMYTFMEAADESKRRGGAPVKISEVLEKARQR